MRKANGASWIWKVRGRGRKKRAAAEYGRSTIGVLTFEIASLMSKTVLLWHSLTTEQIVVLREEILQIEGVRKLVSNDDDFLFGLALAETMNTVEFLAQSVARLGKRCADPVLQNFDRIFAELIMNDSDQYRLAYSSKKMHRKVKKMERFVAAGGSLYQELELLLELEQGFRRVQVSSEIARHGITFLDFRQKVVWQRQAVKCLRDASAWNRSYDYISRLLARSLFTIVDRIKLVFGFQQRDCCSPSRITNQLYSISGVMIQSSVHPSDGGVSSRFASGPISMSRRKSGPNQRSLPKTTTIDHRRPRTKWAISSMPFVGCMAGGNKSPVLESCMSLDAGINMLNGVTMEPENSIKEYEPELPVNIFDNSSSLSMFESRRKLLNAPPSTLGSSALALHYANVIVVIEKLAASPHLIGHDVRDDLYDMLPMSIRVGLRMRLKSYSKNLALSVYDPDLAADWSEAVANILEWLAPLAHNMIKWQSDRNIEKKHLVYSTNILLLQTLYYANQAKTEAAITELLVGLNYLWRFAKELNEQPIHECSSNRNFDDCEENKC